MRPILNIKKFRFMKGFFARLFDSNEKQTSRLQKIVDHINSLEEKYSKMTLEELRGVMDGFRNDLKPLVDAVSDEQKDSIKAPKRGTYTNEERKINEYLEKILPDVYAIIRETSKRIYDRRHFNVQLMGGIVLFEGKISELKTGEGKTQVAWLPLALYGLTKRGAHLITVNDYLAKSHGEYSAQIFSALGYTVGITEPNGSYVYIPDDKLAEVKGQEAYDEKMKMKIKNPGDTTGINLKLTTKTESYQCDILYATNNEIGFDYLRDNMISKIEDNVQRELYFGIVDEVDSILIDEARTPLIIAMPANKSNELYTKFAKIVAQLVPEDYQIDEKTKAVSLTDIGTDKVEKMLEVKNIWENYHYAHHLDNSLRARFIYKNNDEYLIRNGEILIVDDFTGRVLPGRRFGEGLHQAIEAKEGVEIRQESRTMATITFQNLFRIYKHLSGMTGTALTESEEFYKIYNLEVISIPTNKPTIRVDLPDVVYKDQEAKFNAVADEVIAKHETGQPVLVGTTSVAKSEYLSELLRAKGVKHEVLNAKYHDREAHIVSLAGQRDAVTIATNMAGRGTDIKLGEGVDDLGGLYVIGTERHESRRIDNQLRGRSGRQGDRGLSKFYLSLDDEIMRIQGGMVIQKLMSITNLDPSIPIENSLIGRTIETSQKRVEGSNFDIRKTVVEYDDVINKQREIFYTRRRKLLRSVDKSSINKKDEGIDDTNQITRDAMLEQITASFSEYIDALTKNDIHEIAKSFVTIFDDNSLKELATVIGVDYKSGESLESELNVKIESIYKEDEIKEYLLGIVKSLIDLRIKEDSESSFISTYFNLALQVMDELWMEHLETMHDIRSGIFLNSYAQKDPLVEYKNKGFDLFDRMISHINHQIITRIFKIKKIELSQIDIENIMTNIAEIESNIEKGTLDVLGNSPEAGVPEAVTTKPFTSTLPDAVKKVGRNEPCPCGSGKKYKNCHGKDD